jgi:hypothetical protein
MSATKNWFMLHRIRAAILVDRSELLTGTVEIDETCCTTVASFKKSLCFDAI